MSILAINDNENYKQLISLFMFAFMFHYIFIGCFAVICRQWLEIQQYRKRAKKVVDRKASKGRKTRQVLIAEGYAEYVQVCSM